MGALKLIAISDVHLDLWEETDAESRREKRRAFFEFLRWVRERSGTEHFAIVGDLLDVPQPDHSSLLPRFRDLLIHLWAIVEAGIHLHYIVGNHDAGLIGLDVEMNWPPLEIAYPGTIILCGHQLLWLEHGHLLDAWLWAYLQHKCANVAAVPPAEAMRPFLSGCAQEAPLPATTFLYDTVYEALQWRPLQTGFNEDEKRLGIRLMSQHLEETFADVAGPGDTLPAQEEILACLAALGLTPQSLKTEDNLPAAAIELFDPLAQRYYSRLPWRRAAQCRLRALRRQGLACRGVIIGHIHQADLFRWSEEDDVFVYANCGSWLREQGDFVCVDEAGQIISYRRSWWNPLPDF